jgi:radical SAM protein with 4Fe4S-binding SPASM domain
MIQYIKLPEAGIWSKMKNSGAPVSFSFELTARCNNECRHCYVNKPANDAESRARELSVAEIGRIADQAVELGVLWCLLSGGEPLLRSDFEEIYLLLQSKGLLISLYTNATLIRPRHVRLLKMHPPREIEVSVYGVTAATYERVSGKAGSFAQFWRGLHLLLENDIPVRLKAMALRSNLHEHEAIADFCRKHTKDYYRFDPFLNMRFDGDPVRNQEILSERLTAEEIVALEVADRARFNELKNKCVDLSGREVCGPNCNHLIHCGAGLSNFDISYDGQFRLCLCLTAPGTTYDLRQKSLREAWYSFVQQVRNMRSDNEEYLQQCRICTIRDLCMWCPALAYLETGKLDKKVEYFCQLAHQRADMIRRGMNSDTVSSTPEPAPSYSPAMP